MYIYNIKRIITQIDKMNVTENFIKAKSNLPNETQIYINQKISEIPIEKRKDLYQFLTDHMNDKEKNFDRFTFYTIWFQYKYPASDSTPEFAPMIKNFLENTLAQEYEKATSRQSYYDYCHNGCLVDGDSTKNDNYKIAKKIFKSSSIDDDVIGVLREYSDFSEEGIQLLANSEEGQSNYDDMKDFIYYAVQNYQLSDS